MPTSLFAPHLVKQNLFSLCQRLPFWMVGALLGMLPVRVVGVDSDIVVPVQAI